MPSTKMSSLSLLARWLNSISLGTAQYQPVPAICSAGTCTPSRLDGVEVLLEAQSMPWISFWVIIKGPFVLTAYVLRNDRTLILNVPDPPYWKFTLAGSPFTPPATRTVWIGPYVTPFGVIRLYCPLVCERRFRSRFQIWT